MINNILRWEKDEIKKENIKKAANLIKKASGFNFKFIYQGIIIKFIQKLLLSKIIKGDCFYG